MDKFQLEFPISVYGNIEQYNEVLTKARCRIFYKGGNRNGTFITDKFAEELIATLHYVPVKGIFDGDDYTDHGQVRSEGRIYGIVPETSNFAWEQHLDEDGAERTYACCDVLLFTALYPEASNIQGKSQSMELYAPSLKYHEAILNGQKYVVFDHGSFLGLQVLGDDVEPCFEGAEFFSLQQNITDTIQKIKEFANQEEQSEMPIVTFKMSDSQKAEGLWSLLNPLFNEENNWTITCTINDIYDDYALVYNYESNSYERVYYTKNDAEDSLVIDYRKKCFVMDITEEEKNVIDMLHSLNGSTYECVSENLTNADANAEKCVELSTKNVESEEQISTLQQEVTEYQSQISELTTNNTQLKEELDSLNEYKLNIETQEKNAVIAEYADKLSEELLNSYREDLTKYSCEDLDMHLAYELKKTNFASFSKENGNGLVPKNDAQQTGVEAILSRYTK